MNRITTIDTTEACLYLGPKYKVYILNIFDDKCTDFRALKSL